MTWIDFPAYALATAVAYGVALAVAYWPKPFVWQQRAVHVGMGLGLSIFAFFLLRLWQTLDRPPLRTLGETRLWYAFFLPTIGWAVYRRWGYRWVLAYSVGMAGVFMIINHLNQDTYNKALMPALQSPWFVPHVVVYIFAYALLAGALLVALRGLVVSPPKELEIEWVALADNLVVLGFGFLSFGLLFGALWAKGAWGHYWTWDPKETWAFITWLAYLLYLHQRVRAPEQRRLAIWWLVGAFVLLLLCWFGVNYLPSTQSSVHTYGMQS